MRERPSTRLSSEWDSSRVLAYQSLLFRSPSPTFLIHASRFSGLADPDIVTGMCTLVTTRAKLIIQEEIKQTPNVCSLSHFMRNFPSITSTINNLILLMPAPHNRVSRSRRNQVVPKVAEKDRITGRCQERRKRTRISEGSTVRSEKPSNTLYKFLPSRRLKDAEEEQKKLKNRDLDYFRYTSRLDPWNEPSISIQRCISC